MKEIEIHELLQTLNNWELVNNGIEKDFSFKTFKEAIQFINKVAVLAEEVNHHPEIFNSYCKLKLRLTTHDVAGLTLKDIDLARAIDALQ